MAEQTITVCDVCGEPATQVATIRLGTRNYLKDLCTRHASELIKGTRRPKRGRRPGSGKATTSATPRSPRKKATTTKKTTARRRKSTPLEAPVEAASSES